MDGKGANRPSVSRTAPQPTGQYLIKPESLFIELAKAFQGASLETGGELHLGFARRIINSDMESSADQQPPAHLVRRGHRFVSLYLLILIVALAIGLTYRWQHRQVENLQKEVASLNTQLAGFKQTAANERVQVLLQQDVPSDWTTQSNDPDNITLTNSKGSCFVNFYKTADKAASVNKPEPITKAKNASVIKGVKDKGYMVTELPAATLTVQTMGNPTQELATMELSATGPQALRQSYAHFVKEGYYITIVRSCNSANDLPSTDKALLAVLLLSQISPNN